MGGGSRSSPSPWAAFALLSTVALLTGCWIEGGVLLACAALAGVAVSRDLVLFLAALCVHFGVVWHLSFWLFGPGVHARGVRADGADLRRRSRPRRVGAQRGRGAGLPRRASLAVVVGVAVMRIRSPRWEPAFAVAFGTFAAPRERWRCSSSAGSKRESCSRARRSPVWGRPASWCCTWAALASGGGDLPHGSHPRHGRRRVARHRRARRPLLLRTSRAGDYLGAAANTEAFEHVLGAMGRWERAGVRLCTVATVAASSAAAVLVSLGAERVASPHARGCSTTTRGYGPAASRSP